MEAFDVGAVQEPVGDTPEVVVYQEDAAVLVVVRHGPWVEAALIEDGVVRTHVQQWMVSGETVTRVVEVV